MGRWEADARGRLEGAALDLYTERGFEQTTVADIAARAGLSERTFFRHYADKREVLFRSLLLRDLFVAAVADAPAAASPMDAVGLALAAATTLLTQERKPYSLRRQQVIVANAALRERELIKLAGLAADVAAALRERGVGEPAASLVAEAGMAVFRVAFERWISTADDRDLAHHIAESLAELRAVTAT